ncbi:MAG: alkaline phosphatase D family protein [Oceanococcus sp.]
MGKLTRKNHRQLTRRQFMSHGAVGAAALPLLAGCGANDALPGVDSGNDDGGAEQTGGPFQHGIATGDPLSDRIIFWTRVTTSQDSMPVALDVFSDPELSDPVTSAIGTATLARDHTVKLDVAGLQPGTTYYYQFTAEGVKSAIGRTRTAPTGGSEQLRFGVVSCASAAHGYFNAYRMLAKRADIDCILHMGDYIYEYGSGEYGDVRPYEPEHEITTLDDYRTRHAFYKKDPDLIELHRQFPFITTWDDHETADNSYRDGAANHTEGEEGVWEERKGWGQQAYDEWMPIRYPEPGNVGKIWRSFNYGELAEIFFLDTRLYDRDIPAGFLGESSPSGAVPADPLVSTEEDRRMIGPEQMDWLLNGLSNSTAQWKIVANQMVFSQWQIADGGTTGVGVYLNGDAWDGYQAERTQILAHLRDNSIDNVVVLSGDVHSSWCADVTESPLNITQYNPITGGSAAVEFTAPSVTSPPAASLDQIPAGQQAFIALNPHIRYLDFAGKGYVVLNLDDAGAQGDYWYVDSFSEPNVDGESFGIGYRTADGANYLDIAGVSGPSSESENPPALAP